MASFPIVATSTGDAADAPKGGFPVELYGAGSGTAPSFSEITGTVTGAQGANLQAILDGIVARLAAVEEPE